MRNVANYRAFRVAALFISLICVANYAQADSFVLNQTVSDKWRLELGTFAQQADLNISAGPTGEELDVIDLNRLGADENDQALWLSGRWRINRRWHVGLSFVEVDRTGLSTSMDDFVFGEPPDEVNVTVGATVTSNFNTKYYILQGGYSFVRSERANLGIGAGLHVMQLEASIGATITVDGESTDLGTGGSESTVPLPNIYVYGDYALSQHIAVTGNVGWFGLEVDKFDGGLMSLNANLEYHPWRNVGIGLGYTQVNLDLTITEPDSIANFEVSASGPRLYLTASFGSTR